jgi:hypothetical protein
LVRSPRFEPGSSAWQADVLDQARLRPLRTSVFPITNKNLAQIEAKIANTLIMLKAEGRTADQTIKRIATNLTKLTQQCNLDNPEQVKLNIAEMQTTDKHTKQKKKADPQTKNKYASAYNHYCIANNINWKKPYYQVIEKTPLIPTPQDVQAIKRARARKLRQVPILRRKSVTHSSSRCTSRRKHLTRDDSQRENALVILTMVARMI